VYSAALTGWTSERLPAKQSTAHAAIRDWLGFMAAPALTLGYDRGLEAKTFHAMKPSIHGNGVDDLQFFGRVANRPQGRLGRVDFP